MKAKSKEAVYSGRYTRAFEVSWFQPDGSKEIWWASGALPTAEATEPRNDQVFHLVARGTLSPKGRYGHLDGHERELVVKEVLSCEQLNISALQRLLRMNFVKVGEWRLGADSIECNLSAHSEAQNILYAFVIDEEVVYIGKTVLTLKRRMYGYARPSPTQSTNIKGNGFIRKTLTASKAVEIYALPDNGLLEYGGFHVNLAAGLEDALVRKLKPKWNRAGI